MTEQNNVTDQDLNNQEAEQAVDQLSLIQQQLNEYKQNYLRAQADYQNLKKETARWKEDYLFIANENLLRELLPVYSHYATALTHIPEADSNQDWVVGLKHVYDMLDGFMKKCGITKIATIGTQFDPAIHEAIGQQTDTQQSDHQILAEVQPGYKLYDRVLEPAKVIVNKI